MKIMKIVAVSFFIARFRVGAKSYAINMKEIVELRCQQQMLEPVDEVGGGFGASQTQLTFSK